MMLVSSPEVIFISPRELMLEEIFVVEELIWVDDFLTVIPFLLNVDIL